MKKINLITITAFVALVLLFFVSGCKKEETTTTSEQEKTIVNPFDIHHDYLREKYQDVFLFISQIHKYPEYENYEVFMRDLAKVMSKSRTPNPYPEFDMEKYNEPEQIVITELLGNYMTDIGTVGLTESTTQTERTISLMSNHDLQQDMYAIVSQIKFMYKMLEDMIDNLDDGLAPEKPNWERRLINCINCKVSALDNWIDWGWFAITWPEHFIVWGASCGWDATFRSHLYHEPCTM